MKRRVRTFSSCSPAAGLFFLCVGRAAILGLVLWEAFCRSVVFSKFRNDFFFQSTRKNHLFLAVYSWTFRFAWWFFRIKCLVFLIRPVWTGSSPYQRQKELCATLCAQTACFFLQCLFADFIKTIESDLVSSTEELPSGNCKRDVCECHVGST